MRDDYLDKLLDSLPPDVQAARNRHYGSCLREREDAADLEIELTSSSSRKNLTEDRYNEILDILLSQPNLSPETKATLEGRGKLEWRERRRGRHG